VEYAEDFYRDEVLLGVAHPRDRAFTVSEIRGRVVHKHPTMTDGDLRRIVDQLLARGLIERHEPDTFTITFAGWRHLRTRAGADALRARRAGPADR
jgi:hypothetical protein